MFTLFLLGGWLVHQAKTSLAEEFVFINKNNLIIGDNRLAFISLDRSKKYFSSLIVCSPDCEIIYKSESITLFNREIILPVMANSSTQIKKIAFIYSFFDTFLITILIFLIYLFISIPLFQFYSRKSEEERELRRKLDLQAAYRNLAEMVAHDINSPIASLKMVVKKINSIDVKEFQYLLQEITSRIIRITDDLLTKSPDCNNRILGPKEIVDLTKDIFREKELLLGEASVDLTFKSEISDNTTCLLNRDKYFRIISNLVNNAFEALNKPKNKILIDLKKDGCFVIVSIIDNGRGISKDLLKNLGIKRVSKGKKGGNGLAILDIKKVLEEEWNGQLEINSIIGLGSCFKLKIPILNIDKNLCEGAILIDDDELVRMTWEIVAKEKSIDLIVFSTSRDFFKKELILPKTYPVYIDSFLSESERGEVIAKKIYEKGFRSISIISGTEIKNKNDYPFIDKFLGKKCPWIA